MTAMDKTAMDQVSAEITQYKALKEQIKLLESRQTQIKTRLVEALKAYGEEDLKGHLVLDLGDDLKATYQKKVSESINNDRAVELVKSKGLEKECIVQVPTLDQDALMAQYYKGTVSEEDIDSIKDSKVIYALIV